MAQSSAAARSITKQQFYDGINTLQNAVGQDALKYKYLHLIDWELAQHAWSLFEELRESSCCDKDGLRLWTNSFVNNAIGFQLFTREFMLHLLLISFAKVETNRGRRKGASSIKRTSDLFFFDAAEEDKRIVRVLWNLRKYFHVEIADSELNALTTIHHAQLNVVSDWKNNDQVTRFLNAIRPMNKSGGESPSSKKGRVGRKPNKAKQDKGKNAIKSEPSWSSDSEPDVSYFSSEESSSQELAAGPITYPVQPMDDMAVDNYDVQAGSNYSPVESVQPCPNFMEAPPRAYTFQEVVQYSIVRLTHLYYNEPERIQSYVDHLEAFFNPTSVNIYPGDFGYE